jgi:hypothetical protein
MINRSLLKILAVLSISLPGSAFAACSHNDQNWLWNYEGTIGDKYRSGMTLVFGANNEVHGLYFYSTSFKDIKLTGKIINGTEIVLDELNAEGKVSARFEGHFPEHDPRPDSGPHFTGKLECEVIIGAWQKLDSPQKLPFLFAETNGTGGTLEHRYAVAGVSDDTIIDRSARRFWDAVRRGDKEEVASLVSYPITVTLPTGKRSMRGPKDLVANYDAIFSAKYRKAISDALPHNMFVRSEGVMLGNGEIWFEADGKVMALNNY